MGLTRKEIQQDRIRTILTDIYQWAMVYQAYLIGAAVVIVLLMLGAYGWNSYQQDQARAAQEAFSEAVRLYHAPVDASEADSEQPATAPGQKTFATEEERDASTRQTLEKVLADYPATKVASWARYYLALLDERDGKAEEARQTLEELSHDSNVPEVRSLSAQWLAEQAQQQGRYQEAIGYWTSLLDNAASHFPIQGAILELARAYEKNGDNQQALEQYRRLQDEFPTSSQASESRTRVAELETLVGESASPEQDSQKEPESSPEEPQSSGSDS